MSLTKEELISILMDSEDVLTDALLEIYDTTYFLELAHNSTDGESEKLDYLIQKAMECSLGEEYDTTSDEDESDEESEEED